MKNWGTDNIVADRLAALLDFMKSVAQEDAALETAQPIMKRRRLKYSFLQDRTFLFTSVAIIDGFGSDGALLLFALFFVVVGCTHVRNVRIAVDCDNEGVNDFTNICDFIKDLYHAQDFDLCGLEKRWSHTHLKKNV